MEYSVEVEPLRLELHNFARYRHAILDMRNIRVASVVGPNGAGKSSLIVDAILWALFGQTPRSGPKAMNHVVRVGEDEAQVVFDFRLSDKMYRVRRIRNARKNKSALFFGVRGMDDMSPADLDDNDFNEISGSTLTETQKLIEQTIRMDYNTFVTTAIIPQGGSDMFTAHMTDTERKEILGKVLGLDIWDVVLKDVRESLRRQDQELAVLLQRQEAAKERLAAKEELDEKLAQAKEELDAVTSQIEQLERISSLEKDWQTYKADLDRLDQDIAQAQKAIESYNSVLAQEDAIKEAPKQLAKIQAEMAELEEQVARYRQLEKEYSQVQAESVRWEAQKQADLSRIDSALQHALKMQELLAKVPCQGMDIQPSCHLLGDAVAASAQVPELQAQLGELHAVANPHMEKLKQLADAMDAIDIDGLERRIDEMSSEVYRLQSTMNLAAMLESAQQQVAAHSALLAKAVAQRVKLKAICEQLEATIKEHRLKLESDDSLPALRQKEASVREEIGRLKERLADVDEAKKELEQLEEAVSQATQHRELLKVLEEACNKRTGVPALIVENAVPQIESLANKILEEISGGRLSVRLETQMETKAGTIQEVLQVLVLDGGTERPYITYSGAEKFMVDLSLRIGLSKFLGYRAGSSIRFLVIDEGIAAADAANRQHIIEALLSLEEHFSKVIVISHIPELHDALPQRIEVSRDVDGSSVQLVA